MAGQIWLNESKQKINKSFMEEGRIVSKNSQPSVTYILIHRYVGRNLRTYEKEWRWKAIYGPGRSGGKLTDIPERMLDKYCRLMQNLNYPTNQTEN